MAGDDSVRHCRDCHLNVYNLSDMTREEAERLIASREGRLCVRFYRRADGTILTRDCPRGLRALTERVSRIAGTVLSAMMCVAPAFCQVPSNSSSQAQPGSKDKEAGLGLDVTVMDPTGAVIQNAQVVLCRCKGKSKTDASTNAIGVAHFDGLSKSNYEISIAAPGFKKFQQTIAIKKTEELHLKLQIAEQTLTVEAKAGRT